MINKRKKNSRQRGHHTHGWGSKKKHRGAGHRGGRGNAGSGKRGDAKKPSFLKVKKYYGKHGFKMKGMVESIGVINLSQIELMLERLIREGAASKSKEGVEIDLPKAGFNKLLGSGRISSKINLRVDYASAKSIEKVQAAGGKVELLKQPMDAETKAEGKAAKKEG